MMTFKDHFSNHAASYADARPGYPEALFAWLAALCPEHGKAWDAGCGNGQASIALAKHFDAVHATDPSAAQIGAAIADPRVRYAVEPGEKCSLPDASVDLITVAQAYHWFDAPRFCAEAARAAKHGGVVAVWSYAESRVSPAVDAVFDALHNERLDTYWPPEREHVRNRYRDLPFPFTPIDAPDFDMRCDWTLAHYLAYLRSWSASQRYAKETGRDAIAQITRAMAQAWGDPQTVRAVSWPLTLKVGRV